MADKLLGADGVAPAAGVSSIDGSLSIDYRLYSNPAAKKWYNMLQRKGVDAIVRVYPENSYNSNINKVTLGFAVDFSVKVIPPYRNVEGFKSAELITSGRGTTGIANYNRRFVIKAGLKIIIADKEWSVISYSEIKDSTGILVYLLEIESGS